MNFLKRSFLKLFICFLIIVFLSFILMFGCIPLFLPGEKPSISEILYPAFLFFWAPIFVWNAIGLKENILAYIFLGIWWLFLAKILCFLFEKIKKS